MALPRVVLDTNILYPSISRRSPLHWVFEKLISGQYELCVTTEILSEYQEILERKLGADVSERVMAVLDHLPNLQLITKYYRWELISADPDDNKFVDCAIAANASSIVTHDKHFTHLKKLEFPSINIVSAEEFLIILNS